MHVGRLLWLFLLMFGAWSLVMVWEAHEYTPHFVRSFPAKSHVFAGYSRTSNSHR
jgi:hypothetical protein